MRIVSDILFGNTNRPIIKRLAGKNFSANKRRNLFVIFATALTSFMITTVFSIGFSYFETYQLQQARMMGTTADVAITNPTDAQLKQLETSRLVSALGISQRLGSVDTGRMEDAALGLVWLDRTEWSTHRMPTISDVHGSYPVSQNEVMIPTWVLKQMGISSPQLGMKITLSYQLGDSRQYAAKDFVLSGYYTDYMSVRTNHRGAVYVSAEFQAASRLPPGNGGSAMISFSEGETLKNCDKLKEQIPFTAGQEFEIVPASEADGSSILPLIGLLAVFISFSGYLLIYNILYISISRDIRFYGQLKTIGTTKNQIKRIVRAQVFRTSAFGIPTGLAGGAAVSLGVVPYALNMMYSGNAEVGTAISFSPLIFVGAAVFTFLTAFIGSMKPARIAGSISPVTALQYTEVHTKKTVQRGTHGTRLSRMAWNNIFRNKKSTLLVFASLFSGLCLFLVTTGLLSSLNPENFVRQWGESDFALTYSIHEDEALISPALVDEIQQIDGIKDVRLTYAALPVVTMPVQYDAAVFGDFIKSLDGKSGIDFSKSENLTAYTQNFYSGVYGIDRAYLENLNHTLSQPIDITAFENGELVLLCEQLDENGSALIRPGQKITLDVSNGPHIFTVADGFLPADFQSGRGKERGTAPDLYISQNALKELSPAYRVFRVAFNTTGGQDEKVQRQLKAITASQPGIQILSRYEKREEMKGYLLTSRVLGVGLSMILLLTGVVNFINTMAVSVNTRKHEFAVLESVGMTKKQIKRVLLYEGCYYWSISFTFVIILGTAIYMLVYLAFKRLVPYAVFSYPVLPLLLIAGIILAVCLIIPIGAYMPDSRNSIVERLKVSE